MLTLQSLNQWLSENVVQIVLVIVAIGVLFRSSRKDFRGVMVTAAVVLLGLGILAMGTGGRGEQVGSSVFNLLFG